MPVGTVTLRANSHGYLTVHADTFGFTPGSSHNVDLLIPGRSGTIRFSPLTANSAGQAHTTLRSNFTGHLTHGSRLVVRMGAGGGHVASEPIAETGPLGAPGVAYGLIPVEASPEGVSTPWGRAAISYSPGRRTLTVTVDARGLTPGPHAAHIHLGSCISQGPVQYMLQDLAANDRGVVHAVRVFRHVTTPVPARRWYLNIHEGNSKNILSKGQPAILFRPLLCANI